MGKRTERDATAVYVMRTRAGALVIVRPACAVVGALDQPCESMVDGERYARALASRYAWPVRFGPPAHRGAGV